MAPTNSISVKQEYKRRLKFARQYYNFNFDARNKLTPARKAAITRLYNQAAEAESHGLQFVPMKKTKRKKAHLTVPQKYKTGKGVWLPAPKATESMAIDKNNAIVTKTKKWIFKTYAITDPIKFTDDPERFISKLPNMKKADYIRLNIGEHQYMGTQEYNRNVFNKYVSENLVGHKGESPDQFITGVTLVFSR